MAADAWRADSACGGMEYGGESVVACNRDGSGYAENCPAADCLDRK
jgi:hypothetical protein